MPGLALVRPLKYPSIDGLRLYAALAVFSVHCTGAIYFLLGIPPADVTPLSPSLGLRILYALGNGGYGVDIFFVISGYLIGRMISGRGRTLPNYWSFVSRRFWRIYPAFLASLIATTYFECTFLGAYGWTFHWQDFLGNLVFLNSFTAQIIPYNHVSWSLGYEFAFYVAVPAILLLLSRVPFQPSCLALLILSFFAIPQEYHRVVAMFLGLALSSVEEGLLRKFASRIPLLISCLLFYFTLTLRSLWIISDQQFYFVFYPTFLLVFVKATFGQNMLSAVLSNRHIRAFGTISYSLYLWHPVALNIVLFGVMPPLVRGHAGALAVIFFVTASLTLSMALAAASYYLFERPYFSGHKRSSARGDIVGRESHSSTDV